MRDTRGMHCAKSDFVVEHNVNVQDTITHLLRRGGYLVLAAADGATAMDLARQNPISLMIVDPESLQPGWPDLCHQLRSCNETYHVPILMMASSEDEMAQMMRHGPRVDDFIVKSFVWEELRGRVRTLLRGSKRNTESDSGLSNKMHHCEARSQTPCEGRGISFLR